MKGKLLAPLDKTLVVGLGGTGKRVLVQLKRRLLEEGYRDTTQQPDLRLMCLDFDPAEETTLVESNHRGKVGLAPDEICWLDGNQIQYRLENLRQEHNRFYYEEWYPDLEGDLIKMGAHRAGAAQWRPLGRMGLFEHADRIQVVLRQALNRLLEVDLERLATSAAQGVVIYLVCSLGGGTGGGTFLDVAYFLRSLPVEAKQVALFLLPGIYSDYDAEGRLFANTYASLKELAVFANQREGFHARYPNGRRLRVPPRSRSPFDQIFLFDNLLTPNQATNNIRCVAMVMAETIFFDLVEARLGQLHSSASTNQGAHTGARDDSSLGRESVFATVGTLTLLLPSRREVRERLALRCLRHHLLPRLAAVCELLELQEEWEETSQRKVPLRVSKHTSTEERQVLNQVRQEIQQALQRFPSLEAKLEELLRTTRDAAKAPWPKGYVRDAGGVMARELLRRADSSSKKDYVTTWLKGLYNPNDDGSLPLDPSRLPDIRVEGKDEGPLYQARRRLREILQAEARRCKLEAEQGATQALEDLYFFLQDYYRRLKDEAHKFLQEVKSLVESSDSTFQQLLTDLDELLQVLGDGNFSRSLEDKAITHWCWRLLTLVWDHLKLIGPGRVNHVLAREIQDFCQEELVSSTVFQNLINNWQEIREVLEETERQLQRTQDRRLSLVERNLASESFWRSLWKEVAEPLSRQPLVLDFLRFLEEKRGGTDLLASRLFVLAQEYARGQITRVLEMEPELGDLHRYVDPELRKHLLAGARHDHILKDTLLNPHKYRQAYVLAPAYSRRSSGDHGGDLYRALQGAMNNDLDAGHVEVETYDAAVLAEDEPGRIYVRHVSLNHPATNLREISHYYDNYSRVAQNRRHYHVDRYFVEFPEVIEEGLRDKRVTCGNPGCDYDLRDLPRTERFCPGCGLPIRSRCGNTRCDEDHLHLHKEIKDVSPPPKTCPSCGQSLRTYWWRCHEHNLDIRTTSRYCLQCEKEAREGRRDFDDVSRRDDVRRHILCPGCLHDGVEKPLRVEFLEVFDQVPDELHARALEVFYDPAQTRHGYCPLCGAQLLPLCPYSEDHIDNPHFVQRFLDRQPGRQEGHDHLLEAGPFFCTSDQDHIQRIIAECSYCHLPLREGATFCPRCKRQAVEDSEVVAHLQAALSRLKDEDLLDPPLSEEECRTLPEYIRKLMEERYIIWFGAPTADLLSWVKLARKRRGSHPADPTQSFKEGEAEEKVPETQAEDTTQEP